MTTKSIPTLAALLAIGSLALVSCGEDSQAPIVYTFGPPGTVSVVTGENSVNLSWGGSSYEGSPDFVRYVVYCSPVPLAQSQDPDSLAAAEVAGVPDQPRKRSGTVSAAPGEARYYHVRVLGRNPDRLSAGSNEIAAAPRPESDNLQADNSLFDFTPNTVSSHAAWGWSRSTGTGISYEATIANATSVDIIMRERPNSLNASEFVSPDSAMGIGWRRTDFADLGTGDAAWRTADAPPDTAFKRVLTILADHTYAVRTEDSHHAKVRIRSLLLNVPRETTQGDTVLLNQAKIETAFQLVTDFPHY